MDVDWASSKRRRRRNAIQRETPVESAWPAVKNTAAWSGPRPSSECYRHAVRNFVVRWAGWAAPAVGRTWARRRCGHLSSMAFWSTASPRSRSHRRTTSSWPAKRPELTSQNELITSHRSPIPSRHVRDLAARSPRDRSWTPQEVRQTRHAPRATSNASGDSGRRRVGPDSLRGMIVRAFRCK